MRESNQEVTIVVSLVQMVENLPLILYTLITFLFSRGSDVQNVLQASQVGTVCNVLRWIYLLETHRPEQLHSVSVTLKLSRIMCVYLTGKDFVELTKSEVHHNLYITLLLGSIA